MARNVDVSWVYPTTRESGKPLNPADIARVDLELSVDNNLWTPYDSFPAPALSTTIPELDIGTWYVRGFVVDTAGKKSKPLVGSVVVPDETAPGPLANLTLTLV
jgi:hypothetical protein